jgi:uncharacterized protein YndB with AHSA1/START domain
MTIQPIHRAVDVKAPLARAFELFTGRMGDWWPRGRTVGPSDHVAIVIEPQVNGRWFERAADGVETDWGKVLAWEPPSRVLLAWQLGVDWTYNPDFLTEVEITFIALPHGGTRVNLEHRNLERFGDQAAARRAQLDGGWPGKLAGYADLANNDV